MLNIYKIMQGLVVSISTKIKKEYLKGIEFNNDGMVEYMTEELSEFDDDEVVIEILYPSGEPVFYHEGDMKQINKDLERCW